MAWVATAIVGSAIVGAGASAMASKSAAKSQSRATDAASQAEAERLDFEKSRYQDWQDVFGDTQAQLGEYYETLDGDTIEALGVQNIEKEFATAQERLNTQLAQRGLDQSGLQAQTSTDLATAAALGKANVRATAEQQAMGQKLGFLGAGLGLEQSAAAGVSNALGQTSSTQSALASQYGNTAATAAANVGTSIGTGLSTYAQFQARQPSTAFTASSLADTQQGVINSGITGYLS